MCDLHLPTDHDAFPISQAVLLGFFQNLLHAVGIARDAGSAPARDFVRYADGALKRVASCAHAAHLDVIVSESRMLAVCTARVGWKGRCACATLGLARASKRSKSKQFAEQWSEGGKAPDKHANGDLAITPDDNVGYGNCYS